MANRPHERGCSCPECEAADAKELNDAILDYRHPGGLIGPLPKDLQRQVDDGLITADEAERFRHLYQD